MFPVPPDVPADPEDHRGDHDPVEAVQHLLEQGVAVPALAQFEPGIRQRIAPEPGAEEGINLELDLVHAGDARGQCYEGADDRQKPAHEHGDAAEALEEPVRPVQIPPAHQDVRAPAVDEGPAAVKSDRISDRRADIAAERACGGDQEEIETSGEGQVSRKRHDDLGGQRNAGRFDRHQDDDPAISQSRDHGGDQAGERRDDCVEQAGRIPSAKADTAPRSSRICASRASALTVTGLTL